MTWNNEDISFELQYRLFFTDENINDGDFGRALINSLVLTNSQFTNCQTGTPRTILYMIIHRTYNIKIPYPSPPPPNKILNNHYKLYLSYIGTRDILGMSKIFKINDCRHNLCKV